MKTIKGIAASKGIAIGNVLCYKSNSASVPTREDCDVATETVRFKLAVSEAIEALGVLREGALAAVGEKQAMLFEIQAIMLRDPDYISGVVDTITKKTCNAEHAVQKTADSFARLFNDMEDEYLRERAADVKDVSDRVLRRLMGIEEYQLKKLHGQMIVVADDLMPSETIQMDSEKVMAFVTRRGSKISHSAILARTMGIPAVVSLHDSLDNLSEDDVVIVDGITGDVIINPNEITLHKYRAKRDAFLKKKQLLKSLVGKKAISLDGKTIEISANISHLADISLCIDNDADGVGLLRSEFLYIESGGYPTEDCQTEIYREAFERMRGKRVTVRTLDFGADKQAPYFGLSREDNPAMGYRGIRICLKQPDIFITQLRALHRASIYGKLAIMFPMITSLREVHEVKKYVEQVKAQLDAENISYSGNIEYGVMIETPAAVMVSDLIAKEMDFFSIGTNDLTQYALACDRMNPNLSDIYDQKNLAVMRMIALTVRNAHRCGKWCGICGESAADTDLTGLFLKLEVDELSVSPNSVLEVRNKVLNIDSTDVDDDMLNVYMI